MNVRRAASVGAGNLSPHTLVRPLFVCLCFVGCASTPVRAQAVPPRSLNSVELQALAKREEARFAAAVTEEAKTPRLALEALSGGIVVDRARGLVYLSWPELTALDLATGATRWKLPEVQGAAFARSGRSLVVVGHERPKQPVLWFLTLGSAAPAVTKCALTLE